MAIHELDIAWVPLVLRKRMQRYHTEQVFAIAWYAGPNKAVRCREVDIFIWEQNERKRRLPAVERDTDCQKRWNNITIIYKKVSATSYQICVANLSDSRHSALVRYGIYEQGLSFLYLLQIPAHSRSLLRKELVTILTSAIEYLCRQAIRLVSDFTRRFSCFPQIPQIRLALWSTK